MKKLKIVSALILSTMIFTGCEKEESQIDPSVPIEMDKDKSNSDNMKSNTYTESELLDYIEDMPDQTAISIEEVATDEFSIAAETFEGDNVNDPPSPESVWIYPDQIAEALEEAIAIAKATGCARMDVGYGLIAVNGC